jgi:hypothetical protein
MKERSPNAPRTIPTFSPSGSAAGAAVVAGESNDSSSATTSTTSSVASDPPQADRISIRDSKIKDDFFLFVIIYLLLHYLNNDGLIL